MTMNKKDSPEYQKAYEAMRQSIDLIGWNESLDKFNVENPIGIRHETMQAYYTASGGCDCLTFYMPARAYVQGN